MTHCTSCPSILETVPYSTPSNPSTECNKKEWNEHPTGSPQQMSRPHARRKIYGHLLDFEMEMTQYEVDVSHLWDSSVSYRAHWKYYSLGWYFRVRKSHSSAHQFQLGKRWLWSWPCGGYDRDCDHDCSLTISDEMKFHRRYLPQILVDLWTVIPDDGVGCVAAGMMWIAPVAVATWDLQHDRVLVVPSWAFWDKSHPGILNYKEVR